MGWIIAVTVLAVVLLAAWLYDRRHPDEFSPPDAAGSAQREADTWNTRNLSEGGGSSGF